MRVLHVISTLAPASGGPTEVLRNLATAQARTHDQVTVCTTDRANPVRTKLPRSHFRTFYPSEVTLKVFPVLYGPLLFSPALALWLRKHTRTFDIVHVHGLYRFPPTYAARVARKQNVPYIIRPHGSFDPYLFDRSSRSVRLKRLYEQLFDFPNLRDAGAIHYTAEDERGRTSFLQLRTPAFVIPNGIGWDRLHTLPSRGSLRARWRLGDVPIVLFLGRLHFKKGLDLLIPAFDALRAAVPDVQLVVAGPDNDDYALKVRTWVRERALDQAVRFVGPLDRADVVQAYVDADVFCLPSYTENFGMTVAEAMACAVPVVISDQVNIYAEVVKAGAGLVTRCEPTEVMEALRTLLQNPGLRRTMGEAGRKFVQERYAWPVIVNALTREYEAVIERHARATAARRLKAAAATPESSSPVG